jgi:aryl-alcohol dehydrogenase-like predicted oxidoreductase
VHRPDPATDIDETLGALSDLIHSGKVRAIGSSTFPAEAIVEAQWVAERRGRERFLCEQPPYSIFARGIERSVLPTCERYGMGVIPWSPLGGGWLTGKYRQGKDIDLSSGRAARMPQRFDPSLPGNARKLELVEQLVEVAEQAGCSLTHLAVAFVVSHPAVSAAIIGPARWSSSWTSWPGSTWCSTTTRLDAIDAIVPPGTNVHFDDAGWQPPAIAQAWRRRRPLATRGA